MKKSQIWFYNKENYVQFYNLPDFLDEIQDSIITVSRII